MITPCTDRDKLFWEKVDVLNIRRLAKDGVKQVVLSKLYGVSPNQISYIVRRINWRHV